MTTPNTFNNDEDKDNKNKDQNNNSENNNDSKDNSHNDDDQNKDQDFKNKNNDQPTIDLEKVSRDIETNVSEKVSKSVLEKLGEALGLTKKEEDSLPTDPKALREYIDKVASEKAESLFKARDDEANKTEQQRNEELTKGADNFKQLWNKDFTEMGNLGIVPKVEKADDPKDTGNVIKNQVLLKLKEVLDDNATKGIDYVPSLWEITQRYPETLKIKSVAGGNLPISGGSKGGFSNNDEYARIHNTPIEDIVAGQHKE